MTRSLLLEVFVLDIPVLFLNLFTHLLSRRSTGRDDFPEPARSGLFVGQGERRRPARRGGRCLSRSDGCERGIRSYRRSRWVDGDVVAVRVVGRGVDSMLDDGRTGGRVYSLGEWKTRRSADSRVPLSVLSDEFLFRPSEW